MSDLNTFNHPEYGDVRISNVMLEDDNGTDLYEGIEIEFLEEDLPTIQLSGYMNLDDISADEVVELIDDHISFEQHFND